MIVLSFANVNLIFIKMYEWRTGRSCVYKNHAHLVFVTKYRRDVFTKEMLIRVKEIIKETCEQMDCELLELNGETNHIHLLVSIHPKIAASNLIGKLKGKSAYILRKEFWDQIKNKLWGNHFWSPSYCLVSCGSSASLDVVKNYIEQQNTPPSAKAAKHSAALRKS